MINVKVDYMCYLPKTGNTPKITIYSEDDKIFRVLFIDNDNDEIVLEGLVKSGETFIGNRQWYTNWKILVYENDTIVYEELFDPVGKVIFIKSDSYALGDNIAWIPYFDEFRKKHKCTVICSTFFNFLFEEVYPELLFVEPNTRIGNVYAQYYVGASEDGNKMYSIEDYNYIPLQKVATNALGLQYIEIKPKVRNILKSNNIKRPYICISEYASTEHKQWKEIDGWQKVVDFAYSLGYDTYVISKEPTDLLNVINLTGNFSLDDRISQLKESKLFIGVSSGLAWLSWAVGTHVMMISDVTPTWSEFQSDMTRLSNIKIDYVHYQHETEPTKFEDVKNKLIKLLK